MDNHKPHGQHVLRRRLNFDEGAPEETSHRPRISQRELLQLTIGRNTEIIQAERQRAIEKWNFDFENEVPLDGDWDWEKVEPPPAEARSCAKDETDSNRKARNA